MICTPRGGDSLLVDGQVPRGGPELLVLLEDAGDVLAIVVDRGALLFGEAGLAAHDRRLKPGRRPAGQG